MNFDLNYYHYKKVDVVKFLYPICRVLHSQECGRCFQNFNTSKLSKIWDSKIEGAGALKIQWYVMYILQVQI